MCSNTAVAELMTGSNTASTDSTNLWVTKSTNLALHLSGVTDYPQIDSGNDLATL